MALRYCVPCGYVRCGEVLRQLTVATRFALQQDVSVGTDMSVDVHGGVWRCVMAGLRMGRGVEMWRVDVCRGVDEYRGVMGRPGVEWRGLMRDGASGVRWSRTWCSGPCDETPYRALGVPHFRA